MQDTGEDSMTAFSSNLPGIQLLSYSRHLRQR